MELLHSGKVRDIYAAGEDIILVASDRISVYDVVLPTPIPDKGALLTAMSNWWFGQLCDVIPNHIISATEVPEEFAGRALRCRKLDMIPVECVARGYLTGSGLKDYQSSGSVSQIELPAGLADGSKLPSPIFTPSTKAPVGGHDEPISFADVCQLVGEQQANRMRDITLEIYRRGCEVAAKHGIIIADTKIELGLAPDGSLVLADELLTPDSSRFWDAELWRPGQAQQSFDKQFVRDWAAETGWNKQAPGPEIPVDVVAATRAKYIDAYERITAQPW